MGLLQLAKARANLFLEGVAHRSEHHVLVGIERLLGCARTAPATANQSDAERVAVLGGKKIAGKNRRRAEDRARGG